MKLFGESFALAEETRAVGSGDSALKYNKLFPVGVTKYRSDFPGGKVILSKEFLSKMIENWKREGSPKRVVNYNHAQPGSVPFKETIAAGWMVDVQLREDGLWIGIDWTADARALIDEKKFQFLSPEFLVDGLDKNSGKSQGPTLLGAALLNTPYLVELPPVTAADKPEQGEGNKMEKIKEMLGLPPEATEEQVLEALAAKLSEKMEDKPAEGDKPAEDSAKMTELASTVTKLTEQAKLAEAKVEAMELKLKTSEVDAYVADLVKDRKILPAKVEHVKKIAMSDMALAKALFDDAKADVPGGKEAGVPSGVTGDRKAVQKKVNDRVAELQAQAAKSGSPLKFGEAYAIAIKEMTEERKFLFGEDK